MTRLPYRTHTWHGGPRSAAAPQVQHGEGPDSSISRSFPWVQRIQTLCQEFCRREKKRYADGCLTSARQTARRRAIRRRTDAEREPPASGILRGGLMEGDTCIGLQPHVSLIEQEPGWAAYRHWQASRRSSRDGTGFWVDQDPLFFLSPTRRRWLLSWCFKRRYRWRAGGLPRPVPRSWDFAVHGSSSLHFCAFGVRKIFQESMGTIIGCFPLVLLS